MSAATHLTIERSIFVGAGSDLLSTTVKKVLDVLDPDDQIQSYI